MKLTRCDNHPDREAVVSLSIRILPPGSRPVLFGIEVARRFVDLCDECANTISPIIKEEINNVSTR